jgi:predicted RNA-binding protein with PIN domain
MPHLIIDGYNYLNRIRTSPASDGSNLDMLRRAVLDRLVRYKKQKGAKITVVFDAYNSYSPGRQKEAYKGIDVVYSKENETADDVIIGWVKERRAGGIVVVTSDRAIIDEAKRYGVAFLTPPGLEALIAEEAFGKSGDEDGGEAYQGKKKGNPRKLPKKLRKATRALSKV